jgi:hypothetical protein
VDTDPRVGGGGGAPFEAVTGDLKRASPAGSGDLLRAEAGVPPPGMSRLLGLWSLKQRMVVPITTKKHTATKIKKWTTLMSDPPSTASFD